MLLNRGLSWRQGSRPQPGNQAQDLGEQRFGDSDLCELKGNVATVPDDLSPDLNQFLPQGGQ